MFLHLWIYICVGFFFLLHKAEVFQLLLQFFEKGNNLKIGVFWGFIQGHAYSIYREKMIGWKKIEINTKFFLFVRRGNRIPQFRAFRPFRGHSRDKGTKLSSSASSAEEGLAESVKLSEPELSWAKLQKKLSWADHSWAEPSWAELQKKLSWAEPSWAEPSWAELLAFELQQ